MAAGERGYRGGALGIRLIGGATRRGPDDRGARGMKSSDKWLEKLSKLRRDRAKGDPAPHKPLLLLVIFDLAQEGLLPPKTLALTPESATSAAPLEDSRLPRYGPRSKSAICQMKFARSWWLGMLKFQLVCGHRSLSPRRQRQRQPHRRAWRGQLRPPPIAEILAEAAAR
jgi:hypothetical protein